MKRTNVVMGTAGLLVLLGVAALLTSCSPDLWLNQTKERTGNIKVGFINQTDYRACFSFGTWDEWDRTPGPVTLQQQRVAPHTTVALAEVPCRRNFAIGTQDFIDRVIARKADETDTFDADSFSVNVNFSSAPDDSDAAALPTVGTAAGVEKLLGVDFSCADALLFTFVEDPDAPGGFRIDFQVLLDERTADK